MSITIPEFPELTFEEHSHIYKLNGIEIPSVTTVMQPLSSIYYGGIDTAVLNKAASRGTAVHNAIENYTDYGIEDIDPAYQGYFDAWKEWFELRKPEVLGDECRLYHKILRYAGTADLVCVINGRVTLVDYKTSAQVNTKLCAVQLEGYDRALESHGIKIDDRLILHLTKTGYHEVPFARDGKCWSVLSSLLTIRDYMN